MENWYAVSTKVRQERAAREHLERQSFRTHLPLVRAARRRSGRWQSGVEPLFPGYLFVSLDPDIQNTGPIRSTRGVVGLVRFGGRLCAVPDGLVEALIEAQPEEQAVLDLQQMFPPGVPVALAELPYDVEMARQLFSSLPEKSEKH